MQPSRPPCSYELGGGVCGETEKGVVETLKRLGDRRKEEKKENNRQDTGRHTGWYLTRTG